MDIKGKIIKTDKRAIAVVGTRKPSSRGQKIAYEFSFYLAGHGVTIVSGLARGIDSIAHRAAIDAGGRTIAVLGSGLDIIYPPENKKLAEEIVGHGAVVSQFPKGTKPYAKNFLERNGTIAKLSRAVLVIEGARRSGTLSTAGWAANQGREVFAVPGSEITDYLIGEGAAIANSPAGILEYLETLS